jgi:hypothetical protein
MQSADQMKPTTYLLAKRLEETLIAKPGISHMKLDLPKSAKKQQKSFKYSQLGYF